MREGKGKDFPERTAAASHEHRQPSSRLGLEEQFEPVEKTPSSRIPAPKVSDRHMSNHDKDLGARARAAGNRLGTLWEQQGAPLMTKLSVRSPTTAKGGSQLPEYG